MCLAPFYAGTLDVPSSLAPYLPVPRPCGTTKRHEQNVRVGDENPLV